MQAYQLTEAELLARMNASAAQAGDASVAVAGGEVAVARAQLAELAGQIIEVAMDLETYQSILQDDPKLAQRGGPCDFSKFIKF